MCKINKKTNVPESDVAKVIAAFKLGGIKDIKKQKQNDGRWTVIATIPCPPKADDSD